MQAERSTATHQLRRLPASDRSGGSMVSREVLMVDNDFPLKSPTLAAFTASTGCWLFSTACRHGYQGEAALPATFWLPNAAHCCPQLQRLSSTQQL